MLSRLYDLFADSQGYATEERSELQNSQSAPLLDSFEKWPEGIYTSNDVKKVGEI